MLKKLVFFSFLSISIILFIVGDEYYRPTVTSSINAIFDDKNSHNVHLHGTPPEQNDHSYKSNSYYGHLTRVDFQRMFSSASNENDVLSNYELYAYPNFCAYARTLSTYNEFITTLVTKIKSDKQFRKKTAFVPGFTYKFGLRGETSGFHDFVNNEANRIAQLRTQQKPAVKQGNLHINAQELDLLFQRWSDKNKIYGDNVWLIDRLNALQKMRNYKNKCSNVSFATDLDCQLHKELAESRNEINRLENKFAYDHHVQVLAPVVYRCAMQATNERSPIVAFELSDFCRTVTQALSRGMQVLYDTSFAIGKGVFKGIDTVISIDHWKDMATSCLHLGLLFIDAIGQENALDYSIALARSSQDSAAILKFSQQYCLHTQTQKDAINRCIQETYQKIKSMSWHELLENGTEIGITMILDTLAFNAINGFTRAASGSFIKQLTKATENGAIFTEQYAAEVAGFGKLIVEEGGEVATNALSAAKNNLDFFAQYNTKLFNSEPNALSLTGNINNLFERLLNAAKICVKGNNTAAGRAFQKHVVRKHSGFLGEITGSSLKNTEQGMKYINEIIKSADVKFIIRNKEPFGDVLDVRLPDGMGARWSADGKIFIGFLEKRKNKL